MEVGWRLRVRLRLRSLSLESFDPERPQGGVNPGRPLSQASLGSGCGRLKTGLEPEGRTLGLLAVSLFVVGFEHVASEIVGKIAPNRVDMVGVILGVVVLDDK